MEVDIIDTDTIQAAASATKQMSVQGSESMETDRPNFPALSATEIAGGKVEIRKITVPPHRLTPLRKCWMKIYTPLVNQMQLQVRMNLKTRTVDLRTSEKTTEASALQKAADFVKAFMLGFDVEDAMAILRLDDLYIDTFDVQDVKPLKGDHLSRAIGRVAGKGGRTRFTIENVTRTRLVVADSTIHILGSFQNIKIARTAVCDLILGSPPGKVYGHMRSVAARMTERF